MGAISIGDREVDTDVRQWDGDLRRDVSLALGALAGVLLLASLVYYALDASGSGWFLWVAIAGLVVLLLAEAAVLATGIAREEEVGPPWLAGAEASTAAPEQTTTAGATVGTDPDEPAEPPVAGEHPEIDLQCPACSEMFAVEDTGERPLATECPHCGASGHVNLPERDEPTGRSDVGGAGAAAEGRQSPEHEDPLAGLGEEDEPEEDVETISLSCPACDTQFETEDTGERPLRTTCPGCGKSGKLG